MKTDKFHDKLLGMSWGNLRQLQAATIDQVNTLDARLRRLRVREQMILDELVRRAEQDLDALKSLATTGEAASRGEPGHA